MTETYVQLEDIRVMRVTADMKGAGPPAAFSHLESKLPTLKGRKFYGVAKMTTTGLEYHACVQIVDSDDPKKMQLETWVIPGGAYVRRKVMDWEKVVAEGKLPGLFDSMYREHDEEIDPRRFSLEFYRSREELHLLIPVKAVR